MIWEKIINAKGGILGRPVEVKIYDDQSDPTTTARLYEKLITQDEVDVLIAPWSDDMTMPATTVAERYKKPIVTGGAPLDTIWSRGYKYVCGLLPASYDYVGVAVRLLEGNVETAVIMNNELIYTTGFGDAGVTNLKELDIELLAREIYAASATDFTSVLTKFRGLNPDFLIGGTGVEDAIQILRQAKEVGLNAKAFYFTIAPGELEFVNLLSEDAVALVQQIHARGVTIVLIEHVLEAVMAVAQRIIVLDQGRKIADDIPERIVKHPEVIRAYLGGQGGARLNA
ncbi:ABC transporter substrate-binding protein [candidate division KSB3 bacterium]|uniref:ABC transporter substrate-binding protein n=1 Tax=candidate division KSB3 bacterium TaxID=2044937 RepID=A0A9D5JZZ2_9BACT|nr:ABC transporter substrate-binding protein [candidate division KSB3 bacterium]MBD3327338.1 ABC transporter substrate-binding protein [candidate division KSB3 bacterium]